MYIPRALVAYLLGVVLTLVTLTPVALTAGGIRLDGHNYGTNVLCIILGTALVIGVGFALLIHWGEPK